jgi:hypothetical protein
VEQPISDTLGNSRVLDIFPYNACAIFFATSEEIAAIMPTCLTLHFLALTAVEIV